MSGRLEILYSDQFDFIVDSTVYSVPIVESVDISDIRFVSSNGSDFIFDRGENVSLLSFGVLLPNGYTIDSQSTQIYQVRQYNSITNQIITTPLTTFIPFENSEISAGIFVDHQTENNDSPFYLKPILDLSVSMVGVPQSEDGKTYKIKPFIKILHNNSLGV